MNQQLENLTIKLSELQENNDACTKTLKEADN